MKPTHQHIDYHDLEEDIDDLRESLKEGQYHLVYQHCQEMLHTIEQDLATDFGQDVQAATLYEDSNATRRTCYLDTLRICQQASKGVITEWLFDINGLKDIDAHWRQYQALREDIQKKIYQVAYLLGDEYPNSLFLTIAELERFDASFRDHCRLILKQEFFEKFKIIIETLGELDRKDFHKMTEPYKNLRDLCHECLELLDFMRDSRFFGANDTFLDDYERDVNIYLQILWYLALKTDLNKTDKFLNPNTYKGGLDDQVQVFAAISLMEDVMSHLQEARSLGLQDQPATILLEEYAEYLFKILTHEETRVGPHDLQLVLMTEQILAKGHDAQDMNTFDLSPPEHDIPVIQETYRSIEEHHKLYDEQLRHESAVYLQPSVSDEFQTILDRAAGGIGIREEIQDKGEDDEHIERQFYRYEFKKSSREQEQVVFVMPSRGKQSHDVRMLHSEWVDDLYAHWKKLKKIQYMKGIIDSNTCVQEKIKYRMDFAIKFFRKTWFAFRLTKHKRLAVKNPEGRILRQSVSVEQMIEGLQSPLFDDLWEDLKMQYRSRSAVKLQRLRWAWFAERELQPGHFEHLKYNYLDYIQTRWKEKMTAHHKAIFDEQRQSPS